MGGRHRRERENLAHCLVSGGGCWTQGFRQSAQGREVQPPLNVEATVTLRRGHRTFCMQYIIIGIFYSQCGAHVHLTYVNLWIAQSDYSIALLASHVCPDDQSKT